MERNEAKNKLLQLLAGKQTLLVNFYPIKVRELGTGRYPQTHYEDTVRGNTTSSVENSLYLFLPIT